MRALSTSFNFNEKSRNHLVRKENEEKELFLNKKLETIETLLKDLEIYYFSRYPEIENTKLRPMFHWRFYKELELIDDLFVRKDYLDPISANLLMDDIDERLNMLRQDLEKMKLNQEEY